MVVPGFGPIRVARRGGAAFGAPWFGPGGVYFGARLGHPSALFSSSSGPGADPEKRKTR